MLWDYVSKSAPTLVVREVRIDAGVVKGLDAAVPVIRVEGRREGIMTWLMVALGMDTSISLTATWSDVELRCTSFFQGFIVQSIPIHQIAMVEGGFVRPWLLLAFAVLATMCGFWMMWVNSKLTFLVAGLLVAVVCVVFYLLAKTMTLAIQANSGHTIRIQVKRSVIEGIVVSEETAVMLVGALCAMVARAKGLEEQTMRSGPGTDRSPGARGPAHLPY